MRVLLVVESSGGGTGRHVLDLAEGLVRRGCDVHLIYSTGRADRKFLERLSQMTGVRHIPLSMRTSVGPDDFRIVWRVRRYLKQQGPFDAIHGHSSKGGAIARLSALGTGVPAFYTLHGLIMMDPGLARRKWLFYLVIELALSRRTANVIAVAPEEARAAKRLGFGTSRVITIPNGVGELQLASRAEARQLMGFGEECQVVGFVGRLVEQKAPLVLIEAFILAARSRPHMRLAMVGDGPLMGSLKVLAGNAGMTQKIVWLGERDACSVLAGFDLFALSSRKEGLPYVILEAMAAGLPIVATSSSGVESLVEPDANGIVVPTDQAAIFAAALIELLEDPNKMARYGVASKQRAALLTVEKMVDETLNAYVSHRRAKKTRNVN